MELSTEARKARNEYMKQWRKRNPEKFKKHQIDYWERKAGNILHYREQTVNKLYDQGLTQRQIASKLGISVGLVNKLIKSDVH